MSIVPFEGPANPVLARQVPRRDPARGWQFDQEPKPLARMGIGGPIDGKVLCSNSSRLDYRVPTLTVLHDLDSGFSDVVAEAEPRITYLPKLMMYGPRQYRIWAREEDWLPIFEEGLPDPAENELRYRQFQVEVILRLIDADPADNRACRQLP